MAYKIVVDADLQDIVPAYLEARKAELPELTELLVKGNLDALKKAGHKLAGSGGGYGFDKISELGKAIETEAGAENVDEAKRLLSALEDYLVNLEVVYK